MKEPKEVKGKKKKKVKINNFKVESNNVKSKML